MRTISYDPTIGIAATSLRPKSEVLVLAVL